MTLDVYKQECTAMLNSIPPGSGAMADFFMTIRLNKLYELALNSTRAKTQPANAISTTKPFTARLRKPISGVQTSDSIRMPGTFGREDHIEVLHASEGEMHDQANEVAAELIRGKK
jgi:hypothetical protein